MPMNPMVSNPTRARMRRTLPAARDPNVAFAVPAMVAVNPNESTLRGPAALFDDRRRGTYANHNLSKRGCRQQGESEQ